MDASCTMSSLGSLTYNFLFKLSAMQYLHSRTQYLIQSLTHARSVARQLTLDGFWPIGQPWEHTTFEWTCRPHFNVAQPVDGVHQSNPGESALRNATIPFVDPLYSIEAGILPRMRPL